MSHAPEQSEAPRSKPMDDQPGPALAPSACSAALLEYLNDEIQRAEARLQIYRDEKMVWQFHFTDGQRDALLGARIWLEREMPPNEKGQR